MNRILGLSQILRMPIVVMLRIRPTIRPSARLSSNLSTITRMHIMIKLHIQVNYD